jgi:hypothetical protein
MWGADSRRAKGESGKIYISAQICHFSAKGKIGFGGRIIMDLFLSSYNCRSKVFVSKLDFLLIEMQIALLATK